MERSRAGETRKIHPDREVCLLWAVPKKHAERKYVYSVFGLGFCLFIIPLAMCSLGFRADIETLEANLKTHLDQEFTLECLSATTPWFFIL